MFPFFLLNSDLLDVSVGVALLRFRMLLYKEQNSPNWDKVHQYNKRFTRRSRIVVTGGSRFSENSRFRSRRVDSASPFLTFFVHRVVLLCSGRRWRSNRKTKTAQFYQTWADFQSQIVETYNQNITSSHVDNTNRSFMLAHWVCLAAFRIQMTEIRYFTMPSSWSHLVEKTFVISLVLATSRTPEIAEEKSNSLAEMMTANTFKVDLLSVRPEVQCMVLVYVRCF